MSTLVLFFLSLSIGYYLSLTFSHPKRKKNLLPTIRIKNIEILPNVRFHYKNKTYWVHHWVYYSIFFAVLVLSYDSFHQLMLIKGATLGGVFQGLRYPDRFKFRHPRLR